MSTSSDLSSTSAFKISSRAAQQIKKIIAAKNAVEPLHLRVQVEAGGCNGFQYRFKLDTHINEDDILLSEEEAPVIVDTMSLSFLEGAELDYVDKLMGAHFSVNNPNAASSCGCGTSFSMD